MIRKKILFITLLVVSSSAFSQKMPLLTDKEAVISRARKEIDNLMADQQSDLRKLAKENKISGEFIFDITVAGRGQVLSVFVVGSEAEDVKKQNLVKDWIKNLRFNFKMAKKTRYKFQYTFNF